MYFFGDKEKVMEQKKQSIHDDLREISQTSGGSASLDDLKKRGVKKINVLTPDKVEEMVRRKAAEMLAARKEEILGAAAEKLKESAARNKDLRGQLQTLQDQMARHGDCFAQIERLKARAQDLSAALEQTRGILEQERALSFQRGAESQKSVIERYQDEILALKGRVREMETESRAGAERDSLKDEVRRYREQIEALTQDIRALREQPPRPGGDAALKNALAQTESLLAQYRHEIASLREEIGRLNDGKGADEMRKMVSRIEEELSEKISRKLEGLQPGAAGAAGGRTHVRPREAVLDNLFRHEPETNTGAMKVRQQKGESIEETLRKMRSFHDNRPELEMEAPDRDAPIAG